MNTHSDIQLRLLDRFYSLLFSHSLFPAEAGKETSCHVLMSEFRSDSVFTELERYIYNHDRDWLKHLDSTSPDISSADRRLAILLHLGFSSQAIAFLTARPTTAAVHTAKSRLKKHLSACDSLEAVAIRKRVFP